MSTSIDSRRERTHHLASKLRIFSENYRSILFKHKNNLLEHHMSKEGFNTPEYSARIVEELKNIQVTVSSLPECGAKAFDVTVISQLELQELIDCWSNFTSFKAMIARLGELVLVFPHPKEKPSTLGEFNYSRNKLRAKAKALMPLKVISLRRFGQFYAFSERFLELAETAEFYEESGDCSELIAEYRRLHDDLYCEAVVALS